MTILASPAVLDAKHDCDMPGCVVHNPPTDAEIDAVIAANFHTLRRGA